MPQRYYLSRDYQGHLYLVPLQDEVAFEGQAMDHGPAPESAILIPDWGLKALTFEKPAHPQIPANRIEG